MPQYQDMVNKAEWQMKLERQRRETEEEKIQRLREDYELFIQKKHSKQGV
jgi:uncharacterized protein YigA (DUF484 family)